MTTFKQEGVLKKIKDSLLSFLGKNLLKFLLFGSYARGDYDENSDIDVADELKNKIFDIIADIEIKYATPVSAFVISEKIFDFLKMRERRIALDIEKEGIPL